MKLLKQLTIACGLLSACANPVTPTGGTKDEKPPILLETSIQNKATDITPEKITFLFDENIQLLSPKENIIISPIPKINPTFKKGNKYISIELPKGSLTDNTTYTISYSGALSDLNEGNKGDYETFIFSTGKQIDTTILSGNLTATPDVSLDKVKVILKQNENNIYKGIVQKNKFYFYGMKPVYGSTIAFIDANNNNNLDSTETFGYYEGNPMDDSINILIYNVKRKNIELFYTNSNIYVKGLPNTYIEKLQNINVNIFKDTLFCDTQYFLENIITQIPATYSISTIRNKRVSSLQYSTSSIYNTHSTETIITFNENIKTVTKDSINITDTENNKNYKSKIEYINNRLIITTDSNITGKITIPAKSVILTNTEQLKSITLNLETTVSHGTVVFENPYNYPAIIEIIQNQEKIYVYLNSKEKKSTFLKPGAYKGSYFIDENDDHSLTKPTLNVKQGEKWAVLPDIISNTQLENIIILQ